MNNEAIWFTTAEGHCIGIVFYETDHGDRKLYIGVGNGISEEADINLIKNRGARIHESSLKSCLKWLEEGKKDEKKANGDI